MKRRRVWATAVLLTLLSACGSAPKEQFYTLTDGTGGSGSALASLDYAVVVGPVFVPDVVDRPQFVLRMAGSEVSIVEQARWAEPLRQAIGRVVAVNLAHALRNARVSSQAQASTGEADYRVVIDVQRFESTPGEVATLEVTWTVRNLRRGDQETGRMRIDEPVSATGYEALVAAHGRALGRVSSGIVETIRASQQRGVAAAAPR